MNGNILTLTKQEITDALKALGQLAVSQGESIELMVVGGAFMVLAYESRLGTKDVDALIITPPKTAIVRQLAEQIANERGWSADWLNDAVKGFVRGVSNGEVLLESPGILVRAPSVGQALAMKLSAWRQDVDINDALLKQVAHKPKDELFSSLMPYLAPGTELKAQYAFDDLWEKIKG
jgi:hypothetical protein